MFDSVLLEVPRAERRRRKLTLAATLAGESLVIAALVAVPLLYLGAIPGVYAQIAPFEVTPYLPPQPLEHAAQHGGGRARSVSLIRSSDAIVVRQTVENPLLIYRDYVREADEYTPDPALVREGPCCNLAIADVIGRSPSPLPNRPRETVMRLSHVEPGMIVRRVEPQYPPAAKLARIQGEVVLQAQIGTDGTVDGLRVVSGHPMLIGAARDAVAEWLFRPYRLNGAPVPVEARITVRFVLGGN